MPTPTPPDPRWSGLHAVERALARGNMDEVRRCVLELTKEETEIFEAQIGGDTVRLRRAASRGRRGRPRGRVVVLHGIMGAKLDVVDSGGESDRVWFSIPRVFAGRLTDLQLTQSFSPSKPGIRVATNGMFGQYYMQMLLTLHEQWETIPFAYDWRLDIDDAANQLATTIRDWARGEPVHLVAHSMGGLVARRFIQLHPKIWEGMQDPTPQGRGGRLVMLGTPNRGSFAAVLALSGLEAIVKKLALLDFHHDVNELLQVLNTFPGTYQMLPSPRFNTDVDQRGLLFRKATWGTLPVTQTLLDRGRAFQDALSTVIDPGRLLYVAGYDQETPDRIAIEPGGKFKFRMTRDGDGRVPHDLGLLDGVNTLYVHEKHSDLAKNRFVLDGMNDLLATGTSDQLDTKPSVRGRAARAAEDLQKWVPGEEMDPVPPEVEEFAREQSRGPGRARRRSAVDEARLLSMLMEPGTTEPTVGDRGTRTRSAPAARRTTGKLRPKPTLRIEVVCGDITKAAGDVFVVGHYRNVLPQNAEWALDRVVSPVSRAGADEDGVLTHWTKRGLLRGELGEVMLFPWASKPGRMVAVAGMGYQGSFGPDSLRQLIRNLIVALAKLPKVEEIAMVLIGSGEGSLSVRVAVENVMQGLADALENESKLPRGSLPAVRVLRIVELHLDKAQSILDELSDPRFFDREFPVHLELKKRVVLGSGGGVRDLHGLRVAAEAAAVAVRHGQRSHQRAVDSLLRLVASTTHPPTTVKELRRGLEKVKLDRKSPSARDLHVEFGQRPSTTQNPTRISYWIEDDQISVSAITETATVAKRVLRFDRKILDEVIQQMEDPDPQALQQLSQFLGKLMVPQEFRELVRDPDRPLVLEVDRDMAPVHWEMIGDGVTSMEPIALRRSVSRQLRTTYSPPPRPEQRQGQLRALIIGDPGDPDIGDDLPGAREEARAVARIFEEKGVETRVLIGAPRHRGGARISGIEPASRTEVMRILLTEEFDILHYSGHGDFDPKDPTKVGWVFKGGLLTARELERVDRVPQLVFANACLSGLTSNRGVPGVKDPEQALLPSLADEFFKRGVHDYVGSAWVVDDVGAVDFATAFYEELLRAPGDNRQAKTIGAAMLAARKAISTREDCLWAAYQHYGDPELVLRSFSK